MAFTREATNTTTTATPVQGGQAPVVKVGVGRDGTTTYEKALGFINVQIPAANGRMRRIGSMPLRASNAFEKSTFDRLNSATTEDEYNQIIASFMSKMAIDFQAVEDETSDYNVAGF